MMNRYTLIQGFRTYDEAADYAARLPENAKARVVPYSIGKGAYAFAVDVSRYYVREME